uniref:Uncharacterized protein n=1 Tax=Anguilla anguilla TaxID=7936 RepID=A0A0E9W5P7_ANGAN
MLIWKTVHVGTGTGKGFAHSHISTAGMLIGKFWNGLIQCSLMM